MKPEELYPSFVVIRNFCEQTRENLARCLEHCKREASLPNNPEFHAVQQRPAIMADVEDCLHLLRLLGETVKDAQDISREVLIALREKFLQENPTGIKVRTFSFDDNGEISELSLEEAARAEGLTPEEYLAMSYEEAQKLEREQLETLYDIQADDDPDSEEDA